MTFAVFASESVAAAHGCGPSALAVAGTGAGPPDGARRGLRASRRPGALVLLGVEVIQAEHALHQRGHGRGQPRRGGVGVGGPPAGQPVAVERDPEGVLDRGRGRRDRDGQAVRGDPARRRGPPERALDRGDAGQRGPEPRAELPRPQEALVERRPRIRQPAQERGQPGLVRDVERHLDAEPGARGQCPGAHRARRRRRGRALGQRNAAARRAARPAPPATAPRPAARRAQR